MQSFAPSTSALFLNAVKLQDGVALNAYQKEFIVIMNEAINI